MSKYVGRIMHEVYHNFECHFDDKDEKKWFLEELIQELEKELDYINDND